MNRFLKLALAFLVMIISFQGIEATTDAARTYTLQKLRPGTNRPGAPVTHPEETLTFTFDDDGYAVFEITPLSRPSYYVKFINADDEIEVEGFITLTVPGIYMSIKAIVKEVLIQSEVEMEEESTININIK